MPRHRSHCHFANLVSFTRSLRLNAGPSSAFCLSNPTVCSMQDLCLLMQQTGGDMKGGIRERRRDREQVRSSDNCRVRTSLGSCDRDSARASRNSNLTHLVKVLHARLLCGLFATLWHVLENLDLSIHEFVKDQNRCNIAASIAIVWRAPDCDQILVREHVLYTHTHDRMRASAQSATENRNINCGQQQAQHTLEMNRIQVANERDRKVSLDRMQ